ncbi:MAG TPA: CPBP family intramembrane glutamic endopeptidase [bacterium]|nr:CPBP family intramembrane glutamic endopeptidase [bacterium]
MSATTTPPEFAEPPSPLPESAPPPRRALGFRHLLVVMIGCVGAQLAIAAFAIAWIDVRAALRGDVVPSRPSLGPRSLLAMGLTDAVLGIAGAWFFACSRRGLSFAEGLRARLPDARVAVISVAAGAACVVAEIGLVSTVKSDGHELIRDLVSSAGGFAAFCALGLLSPFAEEIYYRGFVFAVFEERIDPRAAAWIVGAWFWLLHFPQYWPNLGGILAVGCLSATTTTLRARTGSIVPGMIAHFVYNGTLIGVAVAARLFMPAP